MKKRVLVLGGSRFLGRTFVCEYSQKYDITVANRGSNNQELPENIKKVKVDRFDHSSLQNCLAHQSWDIIVDSLCYSAKDAKILFDAIGKGGRVICISTRSVYDGEGPFSESHFDSKQYPYDLIASVAAPLVEPKEGEISYGEGKRQAEAFYAQNLGERITILRFPIVIGEGDYTNRVEKHLEAIAQGKSIFFGDTNKRKTSFVDVRDVAKAISFAIDLPSPEVLNVASDSIYLNAFVNLIENRAEKKIQALSLDSDVMISPFMVKNDTSLDCSKLKKRGFMPRNIMESFSDILARC